jgi:hypothetical protein
MRNGKRFVTVRQEVAVKGPARHSTLIGSDPSVEDTDQGSIAVYHGLVSGKVQVMAGAEQKTVDVAETGTTTVVFDLPASP